MVTVVVAELPAATVTPVEESVKVFATLGTVRVRVPEDDA
jgi:hypothetical protein